MKTKSEEHEVLLKGITSPFRNNYRIVTPKEFFLALVQVGQPIDIDCRLKDTHKLETYNINPDMLKDLRSYGIKTVMIGYYYRSKYYIHPSLHSIISGITHVIDRYSLECIKANLKIREFVPKKVRRVC